MKIVAGEREDPNLPLLRGMAIGQSYREARDSRERARREQEQESRLQMKALLDFQQESAKVRREEAKALEKYNQGSRDAKALAAAGSMMERWKSNPRLRAKMERGQVASKALRSLADRGVSEDTLQRILGHLKGYEEDIQKKDERAAADEYLQRGHADGQISDEEFQLGQTFLQSGGKPSVLIGKTIERRQKNAVKATIQKSNMAALEQAAQIIQTMPPGRERDLAEARYHEAIGDSKEMESEGAGARLLKDIRVISIGSADAYEKNKQAREEQVMSRPALGLGGATVGQMRDDLGETVTDVGGWVDPWSLGPEDATGKSVPMAYGGPDLGSQPLGPDYQSYAQGLQAEKERRYPGRVAGSTEYMDSMGIPRGYSTEFQSEAPPAGQPKAPQAMPTEKDVIAFLKAQGLAITPENVNAALDRAGL